MLVGSESQRGIDKPYCRWNWTRNGEDLCIFFTSRDGFQIFSEWASEFLNQKGPATPWVPGSNQAVVELWLGPNQTLPAKSGDDLTRYAWTSGFDATFGHRLGVLGVDHRWSISVVTPKKMEQSKCPTIEKLGPWLATHLKQPTCLAMGRDFFFHYQPPSQWCEMVRLGMGYPFITFSTFNH